MLSLALTLIVTAAIAFAFKSTRAIGIVCIAVFTYIFPWITCGLLASAAFTYYLFKYH